MTIRPLPCHRAKLPPQNSARPCPAAPHQSCSCAWVGWLGGQAVTSREHLLQTLCRGFAAGTVTLATAAPLLPCQPLASATPAALVLGVLAAHVQFNVLALLVVGHSARQHRQLFHAQGGAVHPQQGVLARGERRGAQRVVWRHQCRRRRAGAHAHIVHRATTANHQAPIPHNPPCKAQPTLISSKGLRMPESSIRMLWARRCSIRRTCGGRAGELPEGAGLVARQGTWGLVAGYTVAARWTWAVWPEWPGSI